MSGRSSTARTPAARRAAAPPATPAWRESLPFFVGGGIALVLAAALILLHSPAALARLPLWTFLIAIGSIALVGGTVATFVADPIPDLPVENEIVGEDLIVVSRTRWKDLNKMERWVEGRLATTPELEPRAVARAPAPSPRRAVPTGRTRPRTALRAVPDPTVPTLDELLAGLPAVSDEELAKAELWRETDESREVPPPHYPAIPRPTARRTLPARGPEPRRTPDAYPSSRAPPPVPPVSPSPPAPRSGSDLEQLLQTLEAEAAKVVEDGEIAAVLAPTGVLECAGCGRGVGITERWEHCDECLAAFCASCEDRIVPVGGRNLCDTCRSRPRGPVRARMSP